MSANPDHPLTERAVPLRDPKLSLGGHSIAGLKPENQDAFAARAGDPVQSYYKGQIAALADGVSSASHAAAAAQLAVCDFICDFQDTPPSWSTGRSAAKVLDGINRFMLSRSAEQQWLTTFSAVILKSHTAFLLQVGDSRIARLRDGKLEILTQSHQRQLGQRQVLTRALGADPHLEVDLSQTELEVNDLFLLTSDGVHDFISSQAFEKLLADAPLQTDLERLSRTLVKQALANGSDDNLSCLLVRVDALPDSDRASLDQALYQRRIPPVLKPGQKLDGFEILEVLHASPRSHLYRARDSATGQEWALKAPSANFEDDPLYLQAFIHEAWIGSQFRHPNLMKTQPAPADSPFLYLLCEPIEGQSLRQWMQDHPKPSLAQCRPILTQAVSALRAMQRLDMVHRDLKPENLMIDHQGQLKLVDFGATAVASLSERADRLDEECAQGSAHYTAPESILALSADHRSDQFSLGVIAYEMLTGELPYPGKASKQKREEWRYLNVQQHRSDLPYWLDEVLRRAVGVSPEQRYPAFSDLLTDLTQPSPALLQARQARPLLQRDPVRFWQWLALGLGLLNLVQWLS
ncbi:bifunctional protein-serine/threonine kinase/phosphatase [Ferrimonas pelagia]|uniref:Bifunctional protein-serine/threonine kinase/phosphatase n=1 Tax=Ferrimonas pelagia TaxID=1177826 RepID=A0ABP9FDS9_9GAMM